MQSSHSIPGKLRLSDTPQHEREVPKLTIASPNNFRCTTFEKAKLYSDESVDEQWLQQIWLWIKSQYADILNNTKDPNRDTFGISNVEYLKEGRHTSFICDGPTPHSRVFVKMYRYRAGHNPLRRLRPNRPRREASGLLAYTNKNLPTPKLLAYGELRSWKLFVHGFVITALADIEDIPTCYYRKPENRLIVEAIILLATIHRTGLSHGDACIRNFAVCDSKIMAIDLPSWNTLSNTRWLDDVIRFLGSTLKLTNSESLISEMATIYKNDYGELPLNEKELLVRARAFAASKTRP